MTKNKIAAEILGDLIAQYPSLREFARVIREDGRDIGIWRSDKRRITPRAVIKICELHPDIKPHDLNPDIFPANLTLHFGEENE